MILTMADTRIVSSHDVLPEPTLSRLPWYLAYVSLLKVRRVAYVSSTAIARGIHLDASMVAKDLSFVNVRGKTRIGYEVVELERELRSFLGFDRQHNAVIAGVGRLGRRLSPILDCSATGSISWPVSMWSAHYRDDYIGCAGV